MAVPKFKTSKSKSRSRRANYKATAPCVAVCPDCGAPKLPHRICPSCGFYKGRQIMKFTERAKSTE